MPSEAPYGRLRLAAVHDPASAAWRSFFPEDLPEDWRLAYYAHFWPELLLPASEWSAWIEDPRWVDEAPEEIRLYFEVPAGAADVATELASRLGNRLGGLLFPDPEAYEASDPRSTSVFHRLDDPLLPGLRSAQAFGNEAATVLVLEPEAGLDLRQWRTLLEAIHAATVQADAALAFMHATPEELDQAQTLLRLSGLAWRRN